MTHLAGRLVDHRAARRRVGQVGLDDVRAPPQRADDVGGRLGFVTRPVVAEHHVAAAFGEVRGDDRADAPGAGDEGNAIVERHVEVSRGVLGVPWPRQARTPLSTRDSAAGVPTRGRLLM